MHRNKIFLILLFISMESFSQSDSDNKVHLILSLPYINGFNIQGDDTIRTNWGFLGISAGLDYGDSTRAWRLKVGASTDFFAPIWPVRIEGTYLRSYAVYVSLTRISDLKSLINASGFELGYGINYTRYIWEKIDTFSDPSIVVSTLNNSIGLAGYLNYYIEKTFFIGYMYQPTFLMINENIKFQYQHLMSIDFGIRF